MNLIAYNPDRDLDTPGYDTVGGVDLFHSGTTPGMFLQTIVRPPTIFSLPTSDPMMMPQQVSYGMVQCYPMNGVFLPDSPVYATYLNWPCYHQAFAHPISFCNHAAYDRLTQQLYQGIGYFGPGFYALPQSFFHPYMGGVQPNTFPMIAANSSSVSPAISPALTDPAYEDPEELTDTIEGRIAIVQAVNNLYTRAPDSTGPDRVKNWINLNVDNIVERANTDKEFTKKVLDTAFAPNFGGLDPPPAAGSTADSASQSDQMAAPVMNSAGRHHLETAAHEQIPQVQVTAATTDEIRQRKRVAEDRVETAAESSQNSSEPLAKKVARKGEAHNEKMNPHGDDDGAISNLKKMMNKVSDRMLYLTNKQTLQGGAENPAPGTDAQRDKMWETLKAAMNKNKE